MKAGVLFFGNTSLLPLRLSLRFRVLPKTLFSFSRALQRYCASVRSLPSKNFSTGTGMEKGERRLEDPRSNPKVTKIQDLINSTSPDTNGWDKCWEQGLTPWDLGQPTPIILHLLQTGALPIGRVLVPGCGTGYDVVALASPERYVVGLDISESAVKNAIELSSSSPNSNYLTFSKADFFTWDPTELFDLIFDYTFFCAIDPCKRVAWANRVRELLKPDGELITLMFPISDHVGGPPFKVSVADYEEVLHPMGFKAISIEENDLAIERRKGREKLGRWKMVVNQSLL